jgi:hypothetical protein
MQLIAHVTINNHLLFSDVMLHVSGSAGRPQGGNLQRNTVRTNAVKDVTTKPRTSTDTGALGRCPVLCKHKQTAVGDSVNPLE